MFCYYNLESYSSLMRKKVGISGWEGEELALVEGSENVIRIYIQKHSLHKNKHLENLIIFKYFFKKTFA